MKMVLVHGVEAVPFMVVDEQIFLHSIVPSLYSILVLYSEKCARIAKKAG